MRVGSLFSGIGGLDLGLERAGMEITWQVEIDDYCRRVLAKHWPYVPRWTDVREVSGDELPAVDLICGGFPCQDISYAGRGAGLDGERSGLFFEAIRVVRQCRPQYVLLENVAALLTRGLDRVLGTLAEIGYDAEWHCIPAAAVGTPHIRDRVFVIAYRQRECMPDTTSHGTIRKSEAGFSSVAFEVGNGAKQREIERAGAKPFADDSTRPGRSGNERNVAYPSRSRLEKRQGQDASRAGEICRTKPRRSEWWTTEPNVGRVANGVPNRVHRLRGLGNAVVPQVAEFIGRQIIASRGKEKAPWLHHEPR